MSRGGRRPGGGRKPIPPEQRRVVLSCRVKPETFDAICREAGQGSIGRLLDRIWGAEHAKIDVTDFCKPIDPGIECNN